MNKKIDRRVLRTKRNIRAAFIQLINEKELDQITVTEIASLADVDRKTFYLHYGTVFDIYKDIENELSEELQELLNKEASLNFVSFFRGLNQIMEKDMPFYKTIAEKSSYAFLINECTRLLARKLTEKYAAGSGLISSEQKIKIDYVASGIIGVYINWLRSDQQISLDEIISILSKTAETTLTGLSG